MSSVEQRIFDILRKYLSLIMAKSILSLSMSKSGIDIASLDSGDDRRLMRELEKGIRLYVTDPVDRRDCLARLSELLAVHADAPITAGQRRIVPINEEADIVTARGVGRAMCEELGFSPSVQIKLTTVISELSRNIVQYAGKGEIVLTVLENDRSGIEIFAHDQGPGIENLETILEGKYNSKYGMGMGLTGTRNLVDDFDIKTEVGKGTEVTVRKYFT